MEKILEGNLDRFEAPDLLTFLNMGRRTGVLVLEREGQETKLFLRGGRPVFATSTREALRLGSLLVRMGKVSAPVLEKALERQGRGFRLGQILLAQKLLTEDELASYLKVQVSEVIFDTFEWREGTFVFYDKVPPPAAAVTLEMDLQNLIMEGVRRLDERGRLADVFPDLNMVIEAVANPERVKQSVTFTKEEWQVFFLVDGRRSLNEICRLAGNPDELATLQILFHLLQAKFIALAPPLPETPEGKAEAPDVIAEGTYHMSEPPAALPVEVEFNQAFLARRLDDDTKEVVNAKAVQYMAASTKVIVSRLAIIKDGNETSVLLTRDTHTLGRHRNNDIVISDPKVSSFHARVDRAMDGFTVVDLKSRNGTYVNGRRVETGSLKAGDEIRVGTARLVYKIDYTSSAS